MTKLRAVLIGALAASALLITAGSATAANGVSIPGGNITATSSALTFTGSGGQTIVCRVVLNGSLNTSIAKTTGAAVGSITSGSVSGCSGSGIPLLLGVSASTLNHPWSITYGGSFIGTLPNIQGVSLVVNSASFLINIQTLFGSVGCLYSTNLRATTNGPTITTVTPDNTQTIPLVQRLAGSIADCPPTGTLSGTFALSPSQPMTLF